MLLLLTFSYLLEATQTVCWSFIDFLVGLLTKIVVRLTIRTKQWDFLDVNVSQIESSEWNKINPNRGQNTPELSKNMCEVRK